MLLCGVAQCGVASLMIDIIFATLDARMTIINTTKISEANHTPTHTNINIPRLHILKH